LIEATSGVRDALAAATDALEAAGVDTPRVDAEVLLAAAAGIDRATLNADPERAIEPDAARRFAEMVRRRVRREPVAYITGSAYFRELQIAVNGNVLIPRPETELLVEVGLELRPRRALEVGTGSGAVALALAAELPGVEVLASDSSPAALEVATSNARRLGLAGRVHLLPGMLPDEGEFDLLLANLPYVAEADWQRLAPEIRDWEPREALLAGGDGLAAIGALLAAVREREGRGEPIAEAVALEVGAGQAARVSALLADAGYPQSEVRLDLARIERVVLARRPWI
jgi:release factor glutamine methyltransferase